MHERRSPGWWAVDLRSDMRRGGQLRWVGDPEYEGEPEPALLRIVTTGDGGEVTIDGVMFG